MKYADINKRYTEIVNGYINNGYTINTATMSGTQGEIAKVDVTNGINIIRIMIASFHEGRWNEGFEAEGIKITVGVATDDVKPNDRNTWGTIWNDHITIIRTDKFYQVERNIDYYITDDEQMKKISNTRSERATIRYTKKQNEKYTPSEKAIEISKGIVRKYFGYNRITTSEVKLSKGKNGYIVSYRGKVYCLH